MQSPIGIFDFFLAYKHYYLDFQLYYVNVRDRSHENTLTSLLASLEEFTGWGRALLNPWESQLKTPVWELEEREREERRGRERREEEREREERERRGEREGGIESSN